MKDLWQQALEVLATECSTEEMNHWFYPIRQVQQEGSTIYMTVQNDYHAAWLESEYLSQLKKVFSQLCGETMNISFLLDEQQATPANPQGAPAAQAFVQPQPVSVPQYRSDITSNGYRFLPRYTFETFVVGSGNRFAHAASMSVAENPSKSYNPLFLYGGSGLGKTHLMHAIGHRVMELRPNINVVYTSTETFTSEFIAAVRQGSAEDFKHRYRTADILLVDDIQFLAKKESIQEEFFHTFNFIFEQGKQIVISSDRKPDDIATLEERLRSRFAGGLIIDIQPPDWETRIAILQHKIEQDHVPIVPEAVDYIADNIQSNIRELEGALNTVASYARLHGIPVITMDVVNQVLLNILPPQKEKALTIEDIKQEVAGFYHVKVTDLNSSRRDKYIAHPRHVAMYLCRELLNVSLPAIGREFGGRDHTTVMHGCEKISTAMKKDNALADDINHIRKVLGNS